MATQIDQMLETVSGDYEDGQFGFPNQYINPKDKDANYHYKWAECIFAKFIQGKTGISYKQTLDFDILRSYGNGNQPREYYKDKLSSGMFSGSSVNVTGSDVDISLASQASQRAGWQNVDWKIFSVMPKIVKMIIGMATDMDYATVAECVDVKNRDKKKLKKSLALFLNDNLGWMNQIRQQQGMPIDKPSVTPMDEETLAEYEQSGGFRDEVARILEKLLEYTWKISRWDRQLKRDFLTDLINLNWACTKEYYDTEECNYKIKYIDPKYLAIQYNSKDRYSNPDYAAHLEMYTFSELRAKGIPEEKIQQSAKVYHGKYYEDQDWGKLSTMQANGSYGYDDWKALVLETEWTDTEVKKSEKIKGKYDPVTKEVAYDYEIKQTQREIKKGVKRQIVNTNVRMLRQCSWLVDTDVVFDYGRSNFTHRPKKNKVDSSYHAEKLAGESLTDTVMPVLDQMQLDWLRYQNSMANMPEDGYAINVNMLNNVFNGKNDAGFKQIIQFWKESGIMLYSYQDQYSGGVATPVSPLQLDAGKRTQQFILSMGQHIQMIESHTGLSNIALGGTPNPNQGKATTEYSLAASSNYLKPLFEGLFTLKEMAAQSLVKRIPLAINYAKPIEKAYEGILGAVDIAIIKEGIVEEAVTELEFVARPSDTQKAEFRALVQIALQNGRDNVNGGIDIVTGSEINEMLDNGATIREMNSMLRAQISIHDKKLQENRDRGIQLQGEENMKLAQQQFQTEQQKLAGETEAKAFLDNNEHRNNMELEQLKQTGLLDTETIKHRSNLELQQNAEQSTK